MDKLGIIGKPQKEEHSEYFGQYIDQVSGTNALEILMRAQEQTKAFLNSLTVEQWNYRYEEGKWSIKEMFVHIIDTERVFSYRGLAMSRGDQSDLPAFDHKVYSENDNAGQRNVDSITSEYHMVRSSTIHLFKNMTIGQLTRIGRVSKSPTSARAMAWIIAGHEVHHMKVIRERYLN